MVQRIALLLFISFVSPARASALQHAIHVYEPVVGRTYVVQNGGAFSIVLGFRDKNDPDGNLARLRSILRQPNPFGIDARVARFYSRTSEAILNANIEDAAQTGRARRWLLSRVRELPGVYFAGEPAEMTTK